MTAALATLNPAAQVALDSCEQRIERGLRTFLDVGQALAEIRDSRLYKGTHETFEDYCRERWNFTDRRARQMIEAAEIGTMVPVENERQARALSSVPAKERADVLREAAERSNGKATAKAITEVAKERTAPAAPTETPEPAAVPSTAAAGSGSTPAPAADAPVPLREPDPAPKPSLRLVPDAEQVLAAERRDARAQLSRAVDLIAPVNRKAGYVEVWINQLGPYDDELGQLAARAVEAMAVLDELIERCGR